MKMQARDWESPFIGGYYGRKFNETNKAEDVAKSLYKNL